jgi:hypothetical protein
MFFYATCKRRLKWWATYDEDQTTRSYSAAHNHNCLIAHCTKQCSKDAQLAYHSASAGHFQSATRRFFSSRRQKRSGTGASAPRTSTLTIDDLSLMRRRAESPRCATVQAERRLVPPRADPSSGRKVPKWMGKQPCSHEKRERNGTTSTVFFSERIMFFSHNKSA